MKIGVISDTHDHFDPRIPSIFKTVDHILHGGDIGSPGIIMRLENIAPVTAVLGNTDSGLHFQETERVELADRSFFIRHIIDPHDLDEALESYLKRSRPAVVVFGHSHKPFRKLIGETLFLNPGYAGKPRLNLPRSVALLHCDQSGIRTEFVDLP